MAEPATPRAQRNQLLQRLAPADLALIERHLEPVDMPVRFVVEIPDTPIAHVYFPDSGVVSVVANGGKVGNRIEIGIIGREGMTGLVIVTGDHRSPHSTFVQIAGGGRRITADKLRSALRASATLHAALLKVTQAFMIQISQTAVANARATVAERLARWLLMAHDRVGGDRIELTHEFLSTMLGVRRAGVTIAISQLEKRGVIRAARSVLTMVDRDGLKKVAGDFYGMPEAELRRLQGAGPAPANAKRSER